MKNHMKKLHLDMHQVVLHVSFTVIIDGLGQRTETTFFSSLMADCTVSASTVPLTNYIFCCIHDILSLYPGIALWEVHGAYSAPVPAKMIHHMQLAAVSIWRVEGVEENMN